MKSKASAPGKIILFGEHFVVYGVKAILCAIDKRITVTAEDTEKEEICIKSNVGNLTLRPNVSISEIKSALKPFYHLANEALKTQSHVRGIKITVESDIPLGAGLGSSSACCVAGAAAISGLFSKKSKAEILKMAIEAEKMIFQNTSGADCTVCTFGGIIEYEKGNGFLKIKSRHNFHLVIANSNIEHSTESMVAGVKRFKEKNEEEFKSLCDKESEIVEDVLELFKENKVKEIGHKINQNQEYLEAIGISNEELRSMIKLGQRESFGAKITGAGGGGCIFALSDKPNSNRVLDHFKEKNYDCFSVKIDFEGLNTFN